jgi:hypothetical protein
LQSVSEQKAPKLNQLSALLPEGLLAPTSWLEERGYSRANLAGYVARGWLESPARGVYRRPGPPLKWQHVAASLQLLSARPWHVGGRTALVQRGFGHYVQMAGAEPIFLFGSGRLPSWVNRLGVKEPFIARPDALFAPLGESESKRHSSKNQRRASARDQLTDLALREEPWGAWDWRLCFSSDERAILEFLQDAPAHASIQDADLFMQSLVALRPATVSRLLRACTSVKVKRLFLALAERHDHSWLKRLDLASVDLGTGKRMLVPGGKLHTKYLITLPADLDDQSR